MRRATVCGLLLFSGAGVLAAPNAEVRQTPRPFVELPVAPGLALPAAAFTPLTTTPAPLVPSINAPLPRWP